MPGLVTDAWVGLPWVSLFTFRKTQIYFTVLQARGLLLTLASVSSDVGLDSTVDKAVLDACYG